MHKAIKKNITEYNDGIYNFIVDLIDDAPRFSNKD